MKKKLLWEAVKYVFFGVLTTLVNLIVYFAVVGIAGKGSYLAANVIAWIFAVAFAYVTNKLWVFGSKSWDGAVVRRELPAFVSARLFSLAVEELGLWIMIGLMDMGSWKIGIPGHPVYGDSVAKLVMQVVVIVLNYVFSKLVIFRKRKGE